MSREWTPAPELSVVIASVAGPGSLVDCVNSFLEQDDDGLVEIVVVTRTASDPITRLTLRPGVHVIRVDGHASIPEMRAVGVAHARGAIVALTQDCCVADAGWLKHALRAHESEHLVIGGAVENSATARIVDWAAFFCEYGRFMLPIPTGPVGEVPGPNVTYKRQAFEYFRDLLSPAAWESLWHARLRARGVDLIGDPGLVVRQRKHFTFRRFAVQRYHYSRSFAAHRIARASRVARVLFALGTPALPPVLLIRILSRVWSKRRHRTELLRAIPCLAVFTVVWAFGELVGYALGEGHSAAAVD